MNNDLLNQKYQCLEVDFVWTADYTEFSVVRGNKNRKESVYLLTIMDLSTRQIVAQDVRYAKGGNPLTSADLIKTLHQAMDAKQPPKIFHSDGGGQFTCSEFKQFLQENNIQQSVGNFKKLKHANQAHESFHNTLKTMCANLFTGKVEATGSELTARLTQLVKDENSDLQTTKCTILLASLIEKTKKKSPRTFPALRQFKDDPKGLFNLFHVILQEYNNRAHSYSNLAPVEAEAALVQYTQNETIPKGRSVSKLPLLIIVN
uniref:Putative integrase n=1 Tax=Oltmannsiellopsis viridis TaxID=51324 RepID=Q0QIR0_OLTVI|nr:putative integrase [Oltmannsiellopsis viridis]ABC96343.1 putative integrase [Oltmannsiellopsis viridis]